MPATEIIFLVEEDAEGSYTAQALDESIFTAAEDLETLKIMVKDAVHCHFDTTAERPKIIRLLSPSRDGKNRRKPHQYHVCPLRE